MQGYRITEFRRGETIYYISAKQNKYSLAILASGKVDIRVTGIYVDKVFIDII